MDKILIQALQDMVNLEWGSPEQIDAENKVFALTFKKYGIDWDDHSYLLKATTPEMAEYVVKTIEKVKADER